MFNYQVYRGQRETYTQQDTPEQVQSHLTTNLVGHGVKEDHTRQLAAIILLRQQCFILQKVGAYSDCKAPHKAVLEDVNTYLPVSGSSWPTLLIKPVLAIIFPLRLIWNKIIGLLVGSKMAMMTYLIAIGSSSNAQ